MSAGRATDPDVGGRTPASFSLRQYILVNLLFYLSMIGGLVMLRSLPVDFFPDISFNAAVITTPWVGASSDEVERLVTTKIEDEVRNVAGIKEMRSFSHPDVSDINIDWDETLSDDEYDRALANLRAAIERVDELPEDAEEPYVVELSVAEVYASIVVAVIDEGGVGEAALREVTIDLAERLADLPGIRRASPRGVRDREVRVVIDREALAAADLTFAEVANVINRNNQNVPAGAISAGGGETVVRAVGDVDNLAALGAMVVKKNADGSHVLLRDLAQIHLGFEKRRLIGRYNRTESTAIEVAKESDADVLLVVEMVREFLEERATYLPDGVRAQITFDEAAYVSQRLDALSLNLFCGIVAVVLLLWLTLGFRNAVLAVAAIPFCYLTAIFLFPVLGITINSLSIVGMILVSGMLVDDAIIVLENIYRHVETGESLEKAIVDGANEVMWPVIASVSTTIAAFSPLLLIVGTSGEFMAILPKTVIVCLFASLLECLFILPAHYLHWGSHGHVLTAKLAPGLFGPIRYGSDRIRVAVDRALVHMRDRYVEALDVVLSNRWAFGVFLFGLVALTVGVASRIPVDLFASEFNQVFVSLYGPTSNSLEETDRTVAEIEEVLQEFGSEDVRDFSTYSGMTMNPDTIPIRGAHLAVAYLTLADTKENREYPERVLAKVRERFERWHAENPDKSETLLVLPPRNGPPVGKPVAVQIRADDYERADRIARDMKAYLRSLPGVYNIEDNLLPGPREIRLKMDEARASIHGLTFLDLGTALRASSDGLVASTYKPAGSDEEIDIRLIPEERYRSSVRELMESEVRTPTGYRVKLQDVADVEVDRGYLFLTHHDAKRSVVVYADVEDGVATSESVNLVLQARFADLSERYPDVNIIYGGEFQESAKAFANAGRVFPLAMLLIYIILAAQFRSYAQPLIVMMAVPFGIMGVILGLHIFGYPLSFGTIYVTVGLGGVVVNDSLVLVDFINRARAGGMPLREAVLESGRKRFRAVLLTTLTTVCALIPTALGVFGRSLSFGPLAASFTTGLSLATVFTLLFVPTGYYSLVLLQERLAARFPGFSASPPESRGPTPASA